MELRHLRYFLAVANAKSFTQAAEELGIAQPTLSHQIRQLEAIAETPLFDRLGRKVTLTSAGEILLAHAHDTVRAADAAMQSMTDSSDLLAGKLNIASFSSLNRFISPAIAAFVDQFPKVRVQHRELMSFDMHRAIQDGEVELGFGVSTSVPSGIVTRPLFKERLALACRVGHPFAQGKKINIKELGDTPYVSFPYERFTQNAINTYFKRHAIAPNTCMEAPSIDVMLQVIASTDAVGFVPELFLIGQNGIGYSTSLERIPTRNVAMLSLAKASISAAAREFRKIVAAQADGAKKRFVAA